MSWPGSDNARLIQLNSAPHGLDIFSRFNVESEMRKVGHLMAVATIALIGTWVPAAFAQGQGMMGPGMMGPGMMGMGMGMGMGGGPGMGMIDRVEGRIAFLRAELKITDAQALAWNEFADALRSNARNLGATRRGMMGRASAGQPQAQTLIQRLDAQEQWLSTRLEGTRTLKTAFGKLNDALSAEQRETAEQLLDSHMGMGMGPMALGGMMRGGR
jgi:hypothetical protein